jgi:phosphate transport system protein
MVDKAIARSIEAFEEWDTDEAQYVVDGDDLINDARWQLEEEVVLIIARQAPMARDLRELISVIHISTELERIGDYAKVVARTVLDSPELPDCQTIPRIPQLAALGRDQLAACMEAFVEGDAAMARRVAKQDDELDLLWNRIYRELLTEMIADPDLVPEASGLLWIAHNFERMGDRVTNICERIIYAATGEFEENVHLAGPAQNPGD